MLVNARSLRISSLGESSRPSATLKTAYPPLVRAVRADGIGFVGTATRIALAHVDLSRIAVLTTTTVVEADQMLCNSLERVKPDSRGRT
jgi:hypothetical protein